MKWDKIDKSDIQLLTQAGFIAVNHHWHVKAQTIFQGLRLMRPQSELPTIGFCMNLIGQNQFDEALQLLKTEEHYFHQNQSSYHHILKAIIFRITNRYHDAWGELSADVSWGEYEPLVHVLRDELKNKV